jgi:hypothetical protein
MPAAIDPEVMNVDELPGVWSPVQWDMAPEERGDEVEEQAAASLLYNVDVPEAILRLLLHEAAVERAYQPPHGYDPEKQGDWEDDLITFAFKRPLHLVNVTRKEDYLDVIYDFGSLGRWEMEITPDGMALQRM